MKMHVIFNFFQEKKESLWLEWRKVIIYVIFHVKRKHLLIVTVLT